MSHRIRRIARALAAALALGVAAAPVPAAAGEPEVTVYKTPTCGCCGKWVDHLRAAGFTVKTEDMPDLSLVKQMHGVPKPLAACHTAIVDGYVVEGHVPAADVKRLLAERPKVVGIAVPGMPIGSPGMEGGTPEAYEVLTFTRSGQTTVFARH
jgi:hypothetical protein